MQKFTIVFRIQLDITMLNHRTGMNCIHNNFLSRRCSATVVIATNIQLDILLVGWASNRNFSNMGLSGPIPPEIGLLPSLQTLDFSNYPTNSQSCTGPCNSVLGPIPNELGNLSNLQIL
jgi:hypothetical protein